MRRNHNSHHRINLNAVTSKFFRFLILWVLITSFSVLSAPGDILFSDDFEGTLGQWTVTSAGGDAGISSATANSGSNSLYTRWQDVTVTSDAIDTSAAGQIEITAWIRKGDDTFSENPETGDNLVFQYLSDSNNWITVETYIGGGTQGEIFALSTFLSAPALHNNFRVRFRQLTGSGTDWDYWHIDDVAVTERAAINFTCDDFESGLSNWTITSGGGDAGISSATFNSAGNSLFTRWEPVMLTSNTADTSGFTEVEVTAWIRRGDDSFSEDPDNGENLTVSYLDNTNSWVPLETFTGNGPAGEIFDRTFTLPAAAVHSGFRLRIQQTNGGGPDSDYWHIDDVCVQDGQAAIAGLIGEWRFDELFWNGSNSEVLDSSGNDLHLTAFSALTDNSDPAIPGDPGTCSYGVFNGSVSFIQLDDDTSTTDSLLDIPDNLTITTWINTNVIPSSGLKSILSKDENYEFHINTSGQIFWWWRWATLTTTGPSLTINQWHHIAVTWRSGEQVIYIDGVERARSSRTGSLDINNDPLQVGQDLAIAERFFDGEIDEVRIYENFRSITEVNQIMNETRPCTTTGVCNVTFEDSFNNVAYSNSTGSEAWATDWQETGDDGSASSGNIFVTGGELRMDDTPNSGGVPTLERELDLTGYLDAFVTIDLDTSGTLENGDRFDISASDDGGVSYTVLNSFSNDASGNFSYDLAPFISNNTRLRFRVTNGYGSGGEFIDIDNVIITGLKNCGPDHFTIAHDGSGINCLREAITIRAEDSGGNLVTDYTGSIDINLSTNNGNWFVVDSAGASADPALGTLLDTPADNDGAATYQFVAGDLGSIVLYLENTVAETTNISIAEGSIVDDDTEGDIIFRPFGYVFSPSPITNQIAGRPFDLTLTAAGQTPAQAECGVIEEYTGVKSLNFWSDYSDPITSPTQVSVDGTLIAVDEATSVVQNVTFTNGVATVELQYDDAGEISISAKDEIDVGEPPGGNLDEIIGGIIPFVVRPFGYDVLVTTDPYAIGAGDTVFTTAGAPFNMTLRSVLWQAADDLNNDGIPDPFIDTNGDAIPDTGGDLSDNGVTPNISLIGGQVDLSATALTVTNSNGNISTNNIAFSSFVTAGLANEGTANFAQSWDEVGILQLDANTTSFMASGDDVTGQRINIGRFIPDHFLLSPPVVVEQCGSFTYAGFFDGVNPGLDKTGQMFDLSGTLTAQNLANGTTQNYSGVFAYLTSSDITVQAFNTDSAAYTTGRVNFSPAPLAFINGVSSFSDPLTNYQYDILSSEFDLRLDLEAEDSDNVTSGLVSSNTFNTRLGRLRIEDSFGPETSNLEIRIFADYYNGTDWVINSADSCSTYISTDASLDITSYTDQLNSGETNIFAPVIQQTINSGMSDLNNGLWFTAPGINNYGSVQVDFDTSSQPWMSFDWDDDNTLDDSSARLYFGFYRGSDRVIYWKEIRN
jgi:hypothetical protein